MSGRVFFSRLRFVIGAIPRPAPIAPVSPVTSITSITPNTTFFREYAKSKDRGGGGKNKKSGKVQVNLTQLQEVVDVHSLKSDMEAAVEKLKSDYVQHVSLRTSAGSVESIKVKFEDNEHELQELAQIVRKNPKTIVLNMATFPQAIPAVLDALQLSGMNASVQQEGTTLYLPVPKVTKEHRELLAKNAKVLFIKCRDNIKNLQLEVFKDLKRREGLSEDLAADVRKQVTAITDGYLDQAKLININKHDELIKS